MQTVKEKYQKPILVSIQLIPGENVLAICQQGTITLNEALDPCYPYTLGGCRDAT